MNATYRATLLLVVTISMLMIGGLPTNGIHSHPPSSFGPSYPTSIFGASHVQGETAQDTAVPTPTWSQVNTSVQPSPRELAGMVFDAADGYVVLFGGWNDTGGYVGSPTACHLNSCCFNDTWTYRAGAWTNLSIPGPPPTCAPDMAYDAKDGYVVMYSSLRWFANAATSNTSGMVNQTWIFVHGVWTQLRINEPDAMPYFSTMTYNSASGDMLLFGVHQISDRASFSETWRLAADTWTRVDSSDTPSEEEWSTMAYDVSDNCVLLPSNTTVARGGTSGAPTQAFGEKNGTWRYLGTLPGGLSEFSWNGHPADQVDAWVLGFDPKDGYVLLYGGPFVQNRTFGYDDGQVSLTWSYSNGSWANESVNGPPGRVAPSLTFDGADGYMLLFGGVSGGYLRNVSESSYVPYAWLDDTWIYTAPPVATHVTISTSPPKVCSAVAPDCGVGTTESRVTVGVDVTSVPSNPVWGNDSGKGAILYGPGYWLDAPSMSFMGWGNVTPAGNLDPSVACYRDDNGPTDCPTGPSFSSAKGMTQLTWNWSHPSDGIFDALRQGDTWEISFNVQVAGPPFGPVPVDSCTTVACREAESWSIGGAWSNFSFSPSGNASRTLDSLPLGTLDVLPPVTPSTTPSGSPPPPPPPPPSVGAPAPVGLPVPPTIVPAPPIVGPVSVASALSGVSAGAVAAGILAAGVTRGAVSRPAQKVRVASRVAVAKQGPNVRGEN